LDSLGDSTDIPEDGSSELLNRMIHAASRYIFRDPTAIGEVSTIDADEWSSTEEIECARSKAERNLKQRIENNDIDDNFGGTLEQNLSAHASFTLSLLERLCNAINDSTSLASQEETLKSLITTREFHAAKLLWRDKVAKLSGEIVNLNAKMQHIDNDKSKLERKYNRALIRIKEYEEQKPNDIQMTSSSEGNETTVALLGGNYILI